MSLGFCDGSRFRVYMRGKYWLYRHNVGDSGAVEGLCWQGPAEESR